MKAKFAAGFAASMFAALFVVGSGCSKRVTAPKLNNVEQATKTCEAQGSTLKSFKGSNHEYGDFDFECTAK